MTKTDAFERIELSQVKKNTLANFAGNIWIAIIALISIPVYTHFMGIEAYGLVGFFTAMQGTLAVLDMGLTTTVSLEIAKLSVHPDKTQEVKNMARTLEIIYWIEAVALGILVVVLAPFISSKWLNSVNLSAETVRYSIMIMGLAITVQWPFSFYSGGLMGLQQQVKLNLINIIAATLRSVGAILVLWLVSPTINAFFIWQIVVSIFQTLVTALVLRHNLPGGTGKSLFEIKKLREVWRFSATIGGSTVLAVILSQMDKFILSKILTLEMFGYYTLAVVISTSLSRLISPLVIALFPRFTELITLGDMVKLKQTYHTGCQAMSVIIIPISLFLAFFGKEIILLWTQNHVIAGNTYIFTFFMTLSTMFAGLSHLPLTLQYAHGKALPIFYINLVLTIIGVPAVWFSAVTFGAVGVVIVLMVTNFIYLNVVVQVVHNYALPNEKKQWYLKDVGVPFIAAFFSLAIWRILIHGNMNSWYALIVLSLVACLSVTATALSAPTVRSWLFKHRPNIFQLS